MEGRQIWRDGGNRANGPNCFPSSQTEKKHCNEHHHQKEVQEAVEEVQARRMLSLGQQDLGLGGRTHCKLSLLDHTSGNLTSMSDFWSKLYMTPYQALLTRGKSEMPSCPLCSGKESLKHLLSSCPKAIGDGQSLKLSPQPSTTASITWKEKYLFCKGRSETPSTDERKSNHSFWLTTKCGFGKTIEVPISHKINSTLVIFSDTTKQVVM